MSCGLSIGNRREEEEMLGRNLSPRMALLAGIMVSLGACNTMTKPKIDKKVDQAIERARSMEAVQSGIDKEKAPLGTQARKPGGSVALRAGESIWIQSGKSQVLTVPYNVTRVSIGNPELAGVVVLGPRSILINAKELPKDDRDQGVSRGTRASRSGILSSRTFTPPPNLAETTVILWDAGNHTDSHTVFVTDFSNEQVLLEVTIAEINKTKAEERGVDFQRIGGNVRAGYWLGGGAAGATSGLLNLLPSTDPGSPTQVPPFPLTLGSDRPTFAFQNGSSDITALVTMLEQNGMANILAQPKIMALSGQNAVFQVGGEIPIRIVTSFSAEVEFKAFGTLVNFLPYVSDDGDIILTVTPEVSQPDFNTLVEGVPSFRVRRASTTAKLREGETLVLGGLTQHARTETERGIPYLKDIPWAGQLFRDTTYNDEVNELMVVATPHLVRNLKPTTDLDLPTDRGPLTRDEVKTKPEEAGVTRPRLPSPAYNSKKLQR
jgi:Flp pilus assembly secretin CpaC